MVSVVDLTVFVTPSSATPSTATTAASNNETVVDVVVHSTTCYNEGGTDVRMTGCRRAAILDRPRRSEESWSNFSCCRTRGWRL